MAGMSDFVTVLNTQTGRVGQIPRRLFEHPEFNKNVLVEVVPGTKPYNETLWAGQDAETFTETHPGKVVKNTDPDEEDEE